MKTFFIIVIGILALTACFFLLVGLMELGARMAQKGGLAWMGKVEGFWKRAWEKLIP